MDRAVIHYTFHREVLGGRVIRGDVRVPEGPPPRTAVVVVHGFKGFKDWGFFPWVCGRLAGAGHAVVSFNFSGSGLGPHPERITDLDAFAANTFSRELEELAAVVGWVRDGDLVPRTPRALGLLGHSRGGGDVILHAGSDPGIGALATWSAVSTFERWSEATRKEWREVGRTFVVNTRTGQHLPLDVSLLDDLEAHRERLDVSAAAGRVRAPWLIVHGLDDLTVAPDEARTLARVAPRARLVLVEGAGHTYEVGHPFPGSSPQLDEALDATVRHFARHLRDDPA